MRVPLLLAVAAAGALGPLGGCTPLKSHQGYVIDAELVNSVQPGVDNRDSVAKVLGEPSFRSGFAGSDWYYVSRDSRNFAYNSPHPRQQTTIQISFDRNGTVTTVRRGGLDQVAALDPYGKTTPTLGRKRSFFQDLFGNIGTVGAAGLGGGGGSGDNTGGSTKP
jgi:outer membrane protein assembly factor BamE (lipoprotein component of BamABCDE complex)